MSEKETPKPAEAVAEPKNEDKPEGGEPETAAEAKEGAQAEGGEESKDMENYDKVFDFSFSVSSSGGDCVAILTIYG